jgi:hypothetical protein
MQMFDKAEAEFRELSDKRGIVENDKNKIRKARARAAPPPGAGAALLAAGPAALPFAGCTRAPSPSSAERPRDSRAAPQSPARAQVIAELDEKKREALDKTWRKVDADFGSIFAMLLPGSSAKLEPPEGASFLAGARPGAAAGPLRTG